MALKIRLARAGSKKRPYYHVVVADARSPRDGRFIEEIGYWNPLLPRDGERVKIDADRARHWLGNGAVPTDRISRPRRILAPSDLRTNRFRPVTMSAQSGLFFGGTGIRIVDGLQSTIQGTQITPSRFAVRHNTPYMEHECTWYCPLAQDEEKKDVTGDPKRYELPARYGTFLIGCNCSKRRVNMPRTR